MTLLDVHKTQTFPSHRITQEFSLYRLAPQLLVTGAHESFPASRFLWQWCTNDFWSELATCDYWATPWRVGERTLDWESGAHPQWPSRSSVWPRDPLFTVWPQEASLVSCHSSILFSLVLTLSLLPSLHRYLHSHSMSNVLLPEYFSLPYVPSSCSFSKARQTPTRLSSPKSYLLLQEAFPDYPSRSSVLLQNSIYNSLIALRILMIIMAKHLLITYYVLGSILNTLQRLPYLILTVTPWRKYHYYPHFTEMSTEDQGFR